MVFLFHLSFFLFFLSFLEFLTSNNEEIPLWKRGQELLDSSYSSLCVWNLLVTAVESRFLAFKNDCDTKYLTPKVMDKLGLRQTGDYKIKNVDNEIQKEIISSPMNGLLRVNCCCLRDLKNEFHNYFLCHSHLLAS